MNDAVIGVIGTGVMGGGIAQLFAENGFQTLMWDVNEDLSARGYEAIRKRLLKSVEKGKLPAREAEAIMGRIRPVKMLEDLAPAALIIEAVIESYEAKAKLFAQLEKCVSPNTAIGSNTSSLSITELAKTFSRPDRFLGIHFFNPPTKLELVELISTPCVSPDILQEVTGILAACSKTVVTVKDSPGFIVNRLLLPFINEAAKLVGTGVAGPEAIDTAMRLGAMHPAGPLQVADLIGLDVCKHILETLSASLNDPHYRPAQSIVDLVEAGKLGRKTGQGFYTY